jgi:arylsulfatase A-like enzyme
VSDALRYGLAALALPLLMAGAGPRPETQIRNVVLVSRDTLGAKHVSAYGYERDTTPNLDRLAAEGTLFEHAYTPQVWTMTAHPSMMTGLYPLAHGASQTRRVSPAAIPLPEVLERHGFATAAFMGTASYSGPDCGLGRGFDVFSTGTIHAESDNLKTFAWLEQQARLRAEQPEHRFFLLAHYYDVHSEISGPVPYAAPEPFQRRYLPGGPTWFRPGATDLLERLEKKGAGDVDRKEVNALYDGGVRYVDERGLGPLVERLRQLGLLGETLLVVTADHGEEIFEHGEALHKQPYDETARVPLVLRGPGIPAGRRVAATVELVDLMPTLLSLLALPVPDHVQGHDRKGLLRTDAPAPAGEAFVDGIFGAVPPHLRHEPSSVIREIDGVRWSYVNTIHAREAGGRRVFETRGPGQLYRHDRDPGQQHDVAAEHPALARELERRLLAWYVENDALSRQLGQAPVDGQLLRPEERARLEALGYVE